MLTAKYSKAFEEKSKEEKNKKAKMEVSESDYELCPGNREIEAANEEIDAQIETDVSSSDDAACSLNDSNGLPQAGNSDDIKLAVAFVSMVIVATAVSVLGKLVAIPLYNYPNFLNLFSLLAYVILCFAYVIAVSKFGTSITAEQTQVPKRTFAIFGLLDTLSISIQVFATCYLSGPLLIMLPQAAIPFSMIFSRRLKGEQFNSWQYLGALVVVLGIAVVLEPMLSHRNSLDYICQTNTVVFDPEEFCTLCQVETTQDSCLSHLDTGDSNFCEWIEHDPNSDNIAAKEEKTTIAWALVVIISCIPMTLSSLYKEMTLSEVELDPLYMNGWTAFFQLFYSLALAVPAGMLFSPPVEPGELPQHLKDAWECYFYGTGTVDTGCHPDDMCSQAFWLFNLNFILVVLFTVLLVYLLKYGSTSLLYLAFTIQVPLGNLVFCLPFMPGYTPMHVSDIVGLIVIVTGLVLYRSMDGSEKGPADNGGEIEEERLPARTMDSLQEPLLQQDSDANL